MAVRRAGQIALLRFPGTNLILGKLRPVILIAPTPGPYDDWLVCMLSTQVRPVAGSFDELIDRNTEDFQLSGLKVASVVRLTRLAVVSAESLVGAIGEISPERLKRIRQKLVAWIAGP